VEFAWRRGFRPPGEPPDSGVTFGRVPSGRSITIIWKYVEVFEALEHGNLGKAVFVITAY
jgi:plasmid stabilization system protein ParE